MLGDAISAGVERLARLPGVTAVALGGSRARGIARPDSDTDVGAYYRERAPFSIDDVRLLAEEINDTPEPVVTGFGRWGRWVNGGAWLVVGGQRLDLLYRSIDALERVIDECAQGRFESDYYQQPPYGFHGYVYLGELSICKPLSDPEGVLSDLKQRIAVYPEPLKLAIVNRFLWGAEFDLSHARSFAGRNDVYNTAGCLTRVASHLVQVAYALNERYFVGDKGALDEIATFPIRPAEFGRVIGESLSLVSEDSAGLLEAVRAMGEVVEQTLALCQGLYSRPDFRA